MTSEHPANRGKHNCIALVERGGTKYAREWLHKRMADLTRDPLDPRYVSGFEDQLEKEESYLTPEEENELLKDE